ncbi:MAG: ABC transporter permease [Prevotellaceae bacterium]|jgi:hypothetical protein|nr:ABC transporter permease [Prevotellaceae bacterium]
MNRLLLKLLRQRVSTGQSVGFLLANLTGMLIVLTGLQFYRDVLPLFTQGDSFMQRDYLITTKRITAIGSLSGQNNTFSANEINDLKAQPFVRHVAIFTPSLFSVSAAVGMQQTGMRLSTEMFFESVPDSYIDVKLEHWHFDEQERVIPIIIPRNYLNLYNFGFAQSRSLPKVSEGVTALIQLDITLRGNGRQETCKGRIVGFSDRLNTILVPQTFMEWANNTFAPQKKVVPSRLIVEVNNPADAAIADYYRTHRYETEGNNLDAGKTTYFLRLVVGIVLGIGIVITLLSFYILILSIFLLLQKDTVKLQNLLLTGYSPTRIALPYCLLTTGLNVVVLLLALVGTSWIRTTYLPVLQTLNPQVEPVSLLPTFVAGVLLFVIVSLLNIGMIRKKINSIL